MLNAGKRGVIGQNLGVGFSLLAQKIATIKIAAKISTIQKMIRSILRIVIFVRWREHRDLNPNLKLRRLLFLSS